MVLQMTRIESHLQCLEDMVKECPLMDDVVNDLHELHEVCKSFCATMTSIKQLEKAAYSKAEEMDKLLKQKWS